MSGSHSHGVGLTTYSGALTHAKVDTLQPGQGVRDTDTDGDPSGGIIYSTVFVFVNKILIGRPGPLLYPISAT